MCDDSAEDSGSPLSPAVTRSDTGSVPDITRRPGYRDNGDHNGDPYGPMSGRNLVSIVDDLHDQLRNTIKFKIITNSNAL